MYVCHIIDIDSVIVSETLSNSPTIIGSTMEYTIATVSCTGLYSDTITISLSLKRNSVNLNVS